MLSAIKTGKKKNKKAKKNISESSSSSSSSSQTPTQTQIRSPPREEPKDDTGVKGGESYYSTMTFTTTTTSKSSSVHGENLNRSAADELRLLLQSGGGGGGGGGEAFENAMKPPPPALAPPRRPANDATTTTTTAAAATNEEDDDTNSNNVVVLPPTTSYHPSTSKSNKREDEMTVTELAARERATSSSGGGGHGGDGAASDHMSWDEAMTRNIYRVGKKRKMKMKSGGSNYDGDSDEEVEQMKRHLPGQHHQMSSSLSSEPSSSEPSSSSSPAIKDSKRQEQQQQKEDERTKRRLLDLYKKEQTITSKCYWWVQSSNFAKQRLVAFGEHAVLMMAPLNSSLAAGHHFYIVPIKHSPSFVECSDAQEVWEEVRKFRQALENVYARERKGIVMTETVLPSRSNTSSASSFWQTKLEVVPVPFSALQDAPLYFKQSMTEQAEEWGTHNKVLSVMNPQRPLSSVIPKGFPYFACDFGNLSTSRTATGYAQIIESSSFSTDFGNDTLASMMELDPIRFERKKSFPKGMEGQLMNQFMTKWKPFDWTTSNR